MTEVILQSIESEKQPPGMFFRKKAFLKISLNSLENTCSIVSFLKTLQASFQNVYDNFGTLCIKRGKTLE